jgi:hypothetical protein
MSNAQRSYLEMQRSYYMVDKSVQVATFMEHGSTKKSTSLLSQLRESSPSRWDSVNR